MSINYLLSDLGLLEVFFDSEVTSQSKDIAVIIMTATSVYLTGSMRNIPTVGMISMTLPLRSSSWTVQGSGSSALSPFVSMPKPFYKTCPFRKTIWQFTWSYWTICKTKQSKRLSSFPIKAVYCGIINSKIIHTLVKYQLSNIQVTLYRAELDEICNFSVKNVQTSRKSLP